MRILLGTLFFICGLVGTFLSSWFELAGFELFGPAEVRVAGLLMVWIGMYLSTSPGRGGDAADGPTRAAERRKRALQSVAAGTVIWLLPFGVSLLTFDSMLGLVPVVGSTMIIFLAGR